MSEAKMTTDHDAIRKWTEERGGRPSSVHVTHKGGETGILRIDFPGRGDDSALIPSTGMNCSRNSKRKN